MARRNGTAGDDTIDAFALNDQNESNRYNGLDGDDRLAGGNLRDKLDGGGGDDTINGGLGLDRLFGGAGFDILSYEGSTTGVTVDLAASTVTGVDVIGETISGFEGVVGSLDNDSLTGDARANTLSGGAGGRDSLFGGAGDDLLKGSESGESDFLDGGSGDDTMIGGLGDDTYYVDSVGDVIREGDGVGEDVVETTVSFKLAAGVQVEVVIARSKAELDLTGNEFDQRLEGNSAANVLRGEQGDDVVLGAGGDDELFGGKGADSLSGGGGNDSVKGGEGDDTLTGGGGDDTLDGGLGGRDVFSGSAGSDTYYLDGRDVVSEELDQSGLDVVFTSSDFVGGGIEQIFLLGDGDINVKTYRANPFDFIGSSLIVGNAGDNAIDGGVGSDTLTGGAGRDEFRILVRNSSDVDTVTDFNTGDDIFKLSSEFFMDIDPESDFFFIGAEAESASHRIIYDDETGSLFFDRDGSGDAFAQEQFAAIGQDLDLTQENFSIV